MKIRQPIVLLLGGLLSASSIGCSVINAVVSDYRAASREGRGSADRLVAIGRVFENQGKYDQAEVMYRRAIKEVPSDPAIREQLQQLAQRREGRTFEASATSSAIAIADAVSSRRSAAHLQHMPEPGSGIARIENTGSADEQAEPIATIENESGESEELELTSASDAATSEVASSLPASTVVRKVSAESTGTLVTAEEILAVIESPSDNADLLLNGLRNGDRLETQCLAATLLGDCDPGDDRISEALEQASQTASDARLLLAISDSRIQRDEADASTAKSLIELIQQESGATQLQALSDIRYFAGTESNDDCVAILQSVLDHDDAGIRATAALTLGDFSELDEATAARLRTLASEDENHEVREAARAAISQGEPSEIDETHTMVLDPL